MENKKNNNQIISGMRKAIYLTIGIILGALLWFVSGFFAVMSSSMLPVGTWGSLGLLILNIAIVAVLVWLLPRAANKKFIVLGMLAFFAAVLLIPNPCSIYSYLGGY